MAVDQVAVPLPRCPHCNVELAGMGLFSWRVGMWLILSTYCTDCRKIMHTQVVPTDAPDGPVINA